jgi:signal transduction histidine kinase
LRHSSAFLRFLNNMPHLSYKVRISIFALSFLVCGAFMVLGMIVTNNRGLTPIFAIPVALAAWMFKPREAIIAIGCIFLMLITINTSATHSLLWPFPLTITFICGVLASWIEAFSIGFLRYALELSNNARQQSQQAEQQMAITCQSEKHLNYLKDQFLLNVSHELRTPLTQVRGYIELLEGHHERLNPAQQATFLQNALKGCDELQLLVGNILDTMQINNDVQPPYIEDVVIASVVREIVAHIDTWSQEQHSLHLDIPKDLTVRADQQQVGQVLRNLLSNAFKYSPAQSPVTVRAFPSNAEGHATDASTYVCICVQDAGPGFTSDEIPLLFQKFVRLPRDVTGPLRGTGLGLYISKQFVEAMGGRIWVESAGIPGQGSCFRFTLPCTTHTTSTLEEQTPLSLKHTPH